MPGFGGRGNAEAVSAMQLFTTKLNEITKAQESTRDEFRKLFDDRDKAIRTLAERTKTLGDSLTKLEQGIPTNPILESAIRDLPTLKAQIPGLTNRLGALEKTTLEISANVATLVAKLEAYDSMPPSPTMSQGGQGQPGRSGNEWGSRNIEAQIDYICRGLVRALPKELQPSADTAAKNATKAFMTEFVKNFSQGLKPTKYPQSRQILPQTHPA